LKALAPVGASDRLDERATAEVLSAEIMAKSFLINP
jgi:hypothetical protein